jgi:cyclic beta-1,2-glucan synthetase
VETYKVEPYVMAADVYAVAPHIGRGGWTWYTGSAGWMYRVALESVLGFTLENGDSIRLKPVVPKAWPSYAIRYRMPDDATVYEISVRHAGGAASATLDGQALAVSDGATVVPLKMDGAVHRIEMILPAA